jgi:hypothetical protein
MRVEKNSGSKTAFPKVHINGEKCWISVHCDEEGKQKNLSANLSPWTSPCMQRIIAE